MQCRFAGKLIGRYYDSQGNPTKYLKGVEIKAKRGAQLLEKQKSEEAKIPSCNSKWSQQEGGEVRTYSAMLFLFWVQPQLHTFMKDLINSPRSTPKVLILHSNIFTPW